MTGEPLTLKRVTELLKGIEARFPAPPKFRHGAEMSPETFELLKAVTRAEAAGSRTFGGLRVPDMLRGITIHLVEGMPLGEVREASQPPLRRVPRMSEVNVLNKDGEGHDG